MEIRQVMELSFIQCGFAEAFDYCQFMIIKLNSKQWIAKNYSLPGREMEDIAVKMGMVYYDDMTDEEYQKIKNSIVNSDIV